jgi:hypothetical protein
MKRRTLDSKKKRNTGLPAWYGWDRCSPWLKGGGRGYGASPVGEAADMKRRQPGRVARWVSIRQAQELGLGGAWAPVMTLRGRCDVSSKRPVQLGGERLSAKGGEAERPMLVERGHGTDGRGGSDSAWRQLYAGAAGTRRARWSPRTWIGGRGDSSGGAPEWQAPSAQHWPGSRE